MSPLLESHTLSFRARAMLAAAMALTYELQDVEFPAAYLKIALGLSERAYRLGLAELEAADLIMTMADEPGLHTLGLTGGTDMLARAIGAPGRPTGKDWEALRGEVFAEYGEECVYCSTTDGPFAIDHVLPIARGGSNHRANLVVACKSCNSAKRDKTWREWYLTMQARTPA